MQLNAVLGRRHALTQKDSSHNERFLMASSADHVSVVTPHGGNKSERWDCGALQTDGRRRDPVDLLESNANPHDLLSGPAAGGAGPRRSGATPRSQTDPN
ncbi:hypothetical protein EYF80_054007 [Liparis tanakae]|uniref:Uncharacterized protein n=1 Tax=Liparis tanakae TaxID=230148 RepID=A0A4Z2F505_9TELE|nr:hypothetical protein EYF80_054007 [Liparis tanakae]